MIHEIRQTNVKTVVLCRWCYLADRFLRFGFQTMNYPVVLVLASDRSKRP